jgi:hypothetical protein
LAQEPSVTIVRQNGLPQIDLAKTVSACPTTGLNAQTRQKIIDEAATQWSAFRFPRFAITAVKKYNVVPPGLSPDERRTRADGLAVPRVLSIGYMEDDPEVRERIGSYWASVDSKGVLADQNQIWKSSYGRAGWVQYWSGAFISYIMCKAGLSESEFVRHASHVEYIRPAVAQRDGKRAGYAYTAYDLWEKTPAPGDLLCAARDDAGFAIDDLAGFRRHPQHASYHCEIVVGFDVRDPRKAGVVYGIGGNVINAVSLTEAPMSRGRPVKVRTPNGRNWFALLKLTDAAGPGDFRKVPREITETAEDVARRRLRDRAEEGVVGVRHP